MAVFTNKRANALAMLTCKEEVYRDNLVKDNTNTILYTALKNGSRVQNHHLSIMSGGRLSDRDKIVKSLVKQAIENRIPAVYLELAQNEGGTLFTNINYDPFKATTCQQAVYMLQDMAESKGMNPDDLFEALMDMLYSCQEEDLCVGAISGMNNRSIGVAAFEDYNDTVAASMTTKESKLASSLFSSIARAWRHMRPADTPEMSLNQAISLFDAVSVKAYDPLILSAALTELENIAESNNVFLVIGFPSEYQANECLLKRLTSILTKTACLITGDNLPGISEMLWDSCSKAFTMGIFFKPINPVAAARISALWGEHEVVKEDETTAKTTQVFSLLGTSKTTGVLRKKTMEAVIPQERILGLNEGEAIVTMGGRYTLVRFT